MEEMEDVEEFRRLPVLNPSVDQLFPAEASRRMSRRRMTDMRARYGAGSIFERHADRWLGERYHRPLM
jgi:hypothetical protein